MNLLQNFCQLCQKVPTVSIQSRQTSNPCIYHGQFASPHHLTVYHHPLSIHFSDRKARVTTAYHDFYPHTHHISSASPILQRPYPLLRKHVTWKSWTMPWCPSYMLNSMSCEGQEMLGVMMGWWWCWGRLGCGKMLTCWAFFFVKDLGNWRLFGSLQLIWYVCWTRWLAFV